MFRTSVFLQLATSFLTTYIMPSWNLLSKRPVPINNSSTCGTCAETHVDWVGRQTLKIPSCNHKKNWDCHCSSYESLPTSHACSGPTSETDLFRAVVSVVRWRGWKKSARWENTRKHPHNLTCQKSILYQVMHWLVKKNRLYIWYISTTCNYGKA